MKFPTPSRLLLSFGLSLVATITIANAQYTNGQNANILWGQGNFTTGTAAAPPSVGSFKAPTDFAIDPTTGKFFVADPGNNRVLRFSSANAFVNGAGAEAVFGQINFTTAVVGAVSATTTNAPAGVVVDSFGTLWVADTGNNRVLGFQDASTTNSGNGSSAAATLLFGQINFSDSAPATTQSGMKSPTGVTIDGNGSLYVVDQGNNRILKFTNPYVVGDGITAINADSQLGQTNYLVGTPGTTNSTFKAPTFAKVDGSGNLWVSDTGNNRILFFASVATQPIGGTATKVIGQTDFVTGTAGTTQTTLSGPTGITFDTLNRLYVADTTNNRVLIYNADALSLGNGASASFVLGQTLFTTAGASTTQSTLSAPFAIAYSNQQLWVVDKSNNRVINFTLTPGTPSFIAPGVVKVNTSKKKRVFTYTFQGSNASDSYTLRASVPGSASKLAKVTFLYNGVDVTSSLKAGTFSTGLFGPGQLTFTVQIKPTGKTVKTEGGKFVITLTAVSETNSSYSSQQAITIKLLKAKH